MEKPTKNQLKDWETSQLKLSEAQYKAIEWWYYRDEKRELELDKKPIQKMTEEEIKEINYIKGFRQGLAFALNIIDGKDTPQEVFSR